LARGVVVRRLFVVDGEGALSVLHVWIAAGLVGVSEWAVWRWLVDGGWGRVEAGVWQDGFSLCDVLWEVLAEAGGNVAELRRRMLRA
ncbi:ATP-binding protein, partial [Streptomyces sp. RK23]|nr:ATP-binding protein [Streptomyces sp. RK74B]MBQ1008660.1 ATP-binding protein [Streptomyces sp. RK23]